MKRKGELIRNRGDTRRVRMFVAFETIDRRRELIKCLAGRGVD
jgi:hypothetical protein